MHSPLGFREMRFFISPSSSRFLEKQPHQFETGFRPLLHSHNLITLLTGISTKREKTPDTIFIPQTNEAPSALMKYSNLS